MPKRTTHAGNWPILAKWMEHFCWWVPRHGSTFTVFWSSLLIDKQGDMFLSQLSPSGCWKLPPGPKNFGPLLGFKPYHFLCVCKLSRSLSSVPPHFWDVQVHLLLRCDVYYVLFHFPKCFSLEDQLQGLLPKPDNTSPSVSFRVLPTLTIFLINKK